MAGHVFVVRGDMTQMACDAWLLPVDVEFGVTRTWARSLGVGPGPLDGQPPWRVGERIRRFTADAADDRSRIWLADIGAEGESAEWYADAGCEFARTVGTELAGQERLRPPLLAINHLGTGAGGARDRKGDVLATLFARLHDTIADLGDAGVSVDVVVVSWDAASHSAAQRARMGVLADRAGSTTASRLDAAVTAWDFHDPARAAALRTTARSLAEAAIARNLSVFMGAGVSAGAGLPSWDHLLRDIALVAGIDVAELGRFSDPRDKAALLELELRNSNRTLSELVAARLVHSHYSLQHGLLSGLPSDEFITTNFDELFELAASTDSRDLRVIPPRSGSEPDCRRWLLKLHGTVSEPEGIVLTRGSYIDAPTQRGALLGLVQAMLLTRHMLFVGYGLNDEDFHTLVYEVRLANPPELRAGILGTALTLESDPVRERLWSDDLDIVPMLSAGLGSAEQTVALGGREIEKFLDLVGMIATDRTAFLLDDRYAGMLDDSERGLAEALRPVLDAVYRRSENDATDGWRALGRLLGSMGAPGAVGAGD